MATASAKKNNVRFDNPFSMIDWDELDRWAPRVERDGVDHVLYLEGVSAHMDARELIWE